MAEYYTKPESDARYAPLGHTHNLEDLGGAELPANRIEVPESVAADFDNAFTLDEALASIADQLGDVAAPDLTPYAKTEDVNIALSGKAPTNHSHTLADLGAAAAEHSHNYAAPTHTHTQAQITGLTDALAVKANASALSAKADLVDGKVPAAQLPGYVDDVLEYAAVANFPATGEAGKIYVATGTNKSYRWTSSTYVEIAGGVALGETSATAYRGDRGKIAYDHSQNAAVHVTAAQKTTWDGKADGDHTHTPADIGAAPASHTHNYAAPGHTHAYDDLTGLPTIPTIPSSLPANGGNADTVDGKHAADFAPASHSHTGYAASGHNHNSAYISKNLQFTSDEGSFLKSYKVADGKNILTEMAAYDIGLYTIYSQSGTTGNPKTTEAWRMLFHKTGITNGWVIAFGSIGSVYSNYLDGTNNWRGWKCIVDSTPGALWSGQYYMTSNDGTPQTIYPSKKLSECRTGWVLVWSDYDPGSGSNNTDIHHDFVYKRNVAGANWSGQCMLCDIPRYTGSNANDVDTERRIIKPIYIHDNRIEGSYQNASDERNDVVLRAIYEF